MFVNIVKAKKQNFIKMIVQPVAFPTLSRAFSSWF